MGSYLCHVRNPREVLTIAGRRRSNGWRAPGQAWPAADLEQIRYFEAGQMRAVGCFGAAGGCYSNPGGRRTVLSGSEKLNETVTLSYYLRSVVFCFGGGVFNVIKLLIESHHL
jgi:hypothetical protein